MPNPKVKKVKKVKYHKCMAPKCGVTMSHGSPKYCPAHNEMNPIPKRTVLLAKYLTEVFKGRKEMIPCISIVLELVEDLRRISPNL